MVIGAVAEGVCGADEYREVMDRLGVTVQQLAGGDIYPALERGVDGAPGDEAIRDAVLRELREDSATTDLEIEVDVEGGRVVLLGRVPYVEDVESAEEVAARVPGVGEVEERLDVENL